MSSKLDQNSIVHSSDVDVLLQQSTRIAEIKSLWLSGQWKQLSTQDISILKGHEQQALAFLLVGSAYLQLDQVEPAYALVSSSLSMGIDNTLVAEVLCAGVHNTLAVAFDILDDKSRSEMHFGLSVLPKNRHSDSSALVLRSTTQRSLLEIESQKITLGLAGDVRLTSALLRTYLRESMSQFELAVQLNVAENWVQYLQEDFEFHSIDCSELLKHWDTLSAVLFNGEFVSGYSKEVLQQFVFIHSLLLLAILHISDSHPDRSESYLSCLCGLMASASNPGCAVSVLEKLVKADFLTEFMSYFEMPELLKWVHSEHLSKNSVAFLNLVIAFQYAYRTDQMKSVNFFAWSIKIEHGFDCVLRLAVKELIDRKQHRMTFGLLSERLTRTDDAKLKELLLELVTYTSGFDSKQGEHGHALLMDAVNRLVIQNENFEFDSLNFIEVGTTRELVGGQGSTEQIAKFCKNASFHFVTVDMDPLNAEAMEGYVKSIDPTYELITAKGEDFLERTEMALDIVFLDAYDFDHGGHKESRQQRYEEVLGERINDNECHEMHLKCCKVLVQKQPAHGIIGFDDVWQEDGLWKGKGVTAMPFLLENGYKIFDQKEHSVVLIRNDFKI